MSYISDIGMSPHLHKERGHLSCFSRGISFPSNSRQKFLIALTTRYRLRGGRCIGFQCLGILAYIRVVYQAGLHSHLNSGSLGKFGSRSHSAMRVGPRWLGYYVRVLALPLSKQNRQQPRQSRVVQGNTVQKQ